MSAPTQRDFLAASEAAYGESQPGFAENLFSAASSVSQSTLLSDAGYFIQEEGISSWKPLAVSYEPQDGMYAVAYLTNQSTIVVAFEGTLFDSSQYGRNSLVTDDGAIIRGKIPTNLFTDDSIFMEGVLGQAGSMGISTNNIFLTGHSLGGAEAEYIASLTGMAGATFGAPGLPGYTGGEGNGDFTDYVDYGDPIGNFASNEPAGLLTESIAPKSGENHFGTVQPVGQLSSAFSLQLASYDGALFSPSLTYVRSYHVLSNYAQDLGVTGLKDLNSDTPQTGTNPEDIIASIDAGIGYDGKQDISTLHSISLNAAETRDFNVNIDPQNSEIVIVQKNDLDAPILGLEGDAGTYTINTTPGERYVTGETFVDSDKNNTVQLITDNNFLVREGDVAFQSASDDSIVIQRPRLYSGTIANFAAGDVIDLSKINALNASLESGDVLSIQTAYGTPINIQLASQSYSGDLFDAYSDGNGGTDIGISNVSASANTPTISEDAGSEQFTLTRSGDTSQAATVYVSTTDGTTVAGESANAGNITPFVYQPVTFAAGSSTAEVGVGINDLGLYDGSTDTFGIKVTADQSNNNVLATGQFSIVNNDPAPTISISPTDPIVSESAGSEDFTLTRSGNASQAETVYVSTTDGSTVPGESVNSGAFNPFSYQPVTFAAGSSTAQVGVGINDLGLYDGSTNNYGIQVTADQSNGNVLATGQFSIVNDDPAPTISISPTDPTVSESAGSEDFTLTRSGNASQAETVYVSTTDGSTVPGESVNSGAFNPLTYQPVTFAADSSTAQVGVGINDLGLYDGSTSTYGIQVTADQSNSNVQATDNFSIANDDEPWLTPASSEIVNQSFDNETTLYYSKADPDAELLYSVKTAATSVVFDYAGTGMTAQVVYDPETEDLGNVALYGGGETYTDIGGVFDPDIAGNVISWGMNGYTMDNGQASISGNFNNNPNITEYYNPGDGSPGYSNPDAAGNWTQESGPVNYESVTQVSGGGVITGVANDTIISNGEGDNNFVFNNDAGSSFIDNFVTQGAYHDVITLQSNNFSSVSQVLNAATSDSNGDAVINVSPGSTITMQNVSLSNLRSSPNLVRLES